MFDLIGGTLQEDVKPTPVGASNQFISNFELDIRSYIDWRNRDISFVAADHWMVSMLTTLSQKLGYDLSRSVEDIYRRAGFLANEIAATFGYTTESNTGRLHIGDNGSKTIYLIGESPMRTGVTRTTPYTDMIAIRYISHDSTNLTMGCPAEAEALIGLGIDVIEIDLGLLMLQFTLWMKEQLAMPGGDDKRTPQIFVGMHVLPKLKHSQYAIALMNRCCAIAEGLPVNDSFHRLSKAFSDRTQSGQSIYESFTRLMLSRNNVTFEYLLGTLPVPMMPTLGVACRIPQVAPTRQITWALILSRYNLIRYLFALAKVEPGRATQYPVNDIRRVINRMLGDNGLRAALSSGQAKDVEIKLAALIDQTYA
jgi:hypothetical protein